MWLLSAVYHSCSYTWQCIVLVWSVLQSHWHISLGLSIFFCAKVSLRVTALPWMPSCSIAKCMYACTVNVQRRAIWNDNIKLHESLLFTSNSENSRLYLNRYMWVCLQVGHLSTYNLDIFVALCNLYPTIQIEICDVTKIRCTIISVCALSENCGWQPHCTIHRKCQQACT